ncbi:hypothetical protein [Bradyrhizobium sp. CCGE-LA001]|uniref:hypothetical protein n=1 Tax=Bradyrhizobium sp. CCGE-LA001 TaxID=1223566 RepID=UPI0002AA8D50|nr:hypothetical protein [Bradyrhizobium sp. CCGE-LA001]AMA59444.1 hypothetical protein BCCGELA001_26355 [Bradyrhizobium sp. CCGE-LA001]
MKYGLAMFTSRTVVHLIGDPCLKLRRAKRNGYWCFEFDDHGLLTTKMMLVKNLNDLALGAWLSEGRTFAAEMRTKRKQ